MRSLFCLFLVVINVLVATEKKEEVKTYPLSGFQKFEVLTFFCPYDKIDKNRVYLSEEEELKQLGQVTSSNTDSMLVSVMQEAPNSPVCYFSIDREGDSFVVSVEVFVDVEVVANKYKTATPIWKKTVYSPIQDNSSLNQSIQELIKAFGEDWKKANHQNSKQLSFHIRKAKEL